MANPINPSKGASSSNEPQRPARGSGQQPNRTSAADQTGRKPTATEHPSDKKPAPQYDDRPSQTRGGSGDAPKAKDPKMPHYGDQEADDPRRTDVDAGNSGKRSSGARP